MRLQAAGAAGSHWEPKALKLDPGWSPGHAIAGPGVLVEGELGTASFGSPSCCGSGSGSLSPVAGPSGFHRSRPGLHPAFWGC